MRAVSFILLAACTGGRPLSELGGTIVSVQASDAAGGQPGQFFASFATPGCALLADDIVVMFEGQTLSITQPSEDDGCVQGMTNRLAIPEGMLGGQVTTLTLADPTATWTIAFPGLFNGDLAPTAPVVAGQTATFGWTDGPPIENGCFDYLAQDDQIGDFYNDCTTPNNAQDTATLDRAANTFSIELTSWMFPAPATLDVGAIGAFRIGAVPETLRSTDAVRCDGPAGCWIELSVTTSVTIQRPAPAFGGTLDR